MERELPIVTGLRAASDDCSGYEPSLSALQRATWEAADLITELVAALVDAREYVQRVVDEHDTKHRNTLPSRIDAVLTKAGYDNAAWTDGIAADIETYLESCNHVEEVRHMVCRIGSCQRHQACMYVPCRALLANNRWKG